MTESFSAGRWIVTATQFEDGRWKLEFVDTLDDSLANAQHVGDSLDSCIIALDSHLTHAGHGLNFGTFSFIRDTLMKIEESANPAVPVPVVHDAIAYDPTTED